MLCCGYTLTDFPISIRLTSLALWQSNDCPSTIKATLMNMDKYFMWIHYKRLHNHNKAKHNKTVCIFLGIYCRYVALALYLATPQNDRQNKAMHSFRGIISSVDKKKKHTLMTASNGNIFRVTGPLWGESTGHPHKSQWSGALMFSLIYAWTSSWANSQDAGDLRRHRAHYDIIVIIAGFLFCRSTVRVACRSTSPTLIR